MSYLFEPVRFDGKPLLWGHKSVTTDNFSGYYHWHQCCEILFVHEGKGNIIVNRKTYDIRRGMLFFFQPFQLHKVFANVGKECPYIRTLVHFDPFSLEEHLRSFSSLHALYVHLWKGNAAQSAIDALSSADYLEQVFELYHRSAAPGRGVHEEDIVMLMLQILNGISSVAQNTQRKPGDERNTRAFSYAETIMQWIEEHYMEEVRLDELARNLHLSKFYISRLFQQETGSGISQYLIARRIKQACRLLQTTKLPVERIGFEVGIPNVSYFIRLFKKEVGTTPLKYRNRGE